jgi:allantoinase
MRISSRRVVFSNGVRPATLHVKEGKIVAIDDASADSHAVGLLDAGDLMVLPGLVDSHVHINEPGRTHWEGFATATRAAAAGGVTTLVDMPLNSIPATINVAALDEKRRAAVNQCHVDVGFWGGVVPGNVPDLEPLARAGVRGFKCFLSPSGVDEFAHVDEDDLRAALPILAKLDLPLLVHAELPAALTAPQGDPRHYGTWLDSRPAAAETAAIEMVLRLARPCGARVHVVHLATGDALPALQAARRRDSSVTVETCPHYLAFAAEDIAAGATMFKCAPPIRPAVERERLWRALLDGDIDLVTTDHSPSPPSMKRLDEGDFVGAWGGISSLQLGLSGIWTGAVARGADPTLVARWMAERPARLAGLFPIKGTIAVGADADLVIWDPDAEWTVDARALFHRHALTPYDGLRLRGRVQTTLLRGSVVFDHGACTGPASGRLL